MELKLDDRFNSYEAMKYPLVSPLGAAILCIVPSMHLTSNQLVVPVWMYEIF